MSHVTVFTALLVLFFAQGSSGSIVFRATIPQKETADEHMQKAQAAISAKKYQDAKSELNFVLKMAPDARTYLLLAEVHRRLGEDSNAIRYAKEAIKRQSAYPEAHYLLALLLFQTDKTIEAQQALEAGLKEAPQYAPLHMLKGDLDLATSKPVDDLKTYDPKLDSAAKAYNEALRLAPANGTYVPEVRKRLTGLDNYVDLVLHEDDASYVKAKPLNSPKPNYTEAARLAKVEGVIKMGITIDERGELSSVVLFSHLGHGLDEEAARAAHLLRFSPATKAGQPLSSWARMELEFELRQGPRK